MSQPVTAQPTNKMRRDSQSQTETTSTNWKNQRRMSLEGKLNNVAETMVMNTSCLAIGNICIRKHKILQVLWCLAFVFCSICTIHQLYSLTVTYLLYPISTYIELKTGSVVFPSVTICNLNPIRYSKIKANGSQELIAFIEDFKSKSYFTRDNGTEMDTHMRDWAKLQKIISNQSLEARFEMGHQMQDFILQCSFDGIKCDMDKLFMTEISEEYGNCYTLNGWHKFNKSSAEVITGSGRSHGLILTLFLEYDEYLPNLVSTAGIRIHIHEPTSLEQPSTLGFTLPPGFESLLSITEKRIYRLGNPHGNCSHGEEMERDYRMKYTRDSCRSLCKHKYIAKFCRCMDPIKSHLYLDKTLPNCTTVDQIDCLTDTTESFDTVNKCNCPLSCKEIRYSLQQSLSQWPADSYQKRLFGDLSDINSKMYQLVNESYSLARRNLLNVVIFQEGSLYTQMIQKPTYEMDSFLSDIGGTLSLFLGFSVLTGFEVFEAFCLLITFLVGRIVYCDNKCATGEDGETKELISDTGPPKQTYSEFYAAK